MLESISLPHVLCFAIGAVAMAIGQRLVGRRRRVGEAAFYTVVAHRRDGRLVADVYEDSRGLTLCEDQEPCEALMQLDVSLQGFANEIKASDAAMAAAG